MSGLIADIAAAALATEVASSDALQRIAAALSPVVLVSAAALLAVGVSQRQTSLGDRIRSLAAELRDPGIQPERRADILAELPLFAARVHHAGMAHRFIYAAIACFLAMILVIMMRVPTSAIPEVLSLALFAVGIVLLLAGIVFDILDLRLANRTLARELGAATTRAGAG